MMRIHAKNMVANQRGDLWQPVNRYQIHGVDQEHPDKYGQRHRGDHCISAAESAFYTGIDELDDHLNEILHATGHTRGRGFRHFSKQVQEQNTEKYRPEHGVDMDRHEAHFLGLLCIVRKAPLTGMFMTLRKLTVGKVLQMVLDIFSSGLGFTRHY